MKNSYEKLSLIQMLEDKIFIAIVSKQCKKFNFTTSLFFKKINQNFFHVMYQQVFSSNFELGLLCVLYTVIDFDVSYLFLGLMLLIQGTHERV